MNSKDSLSTSHVAWLQAIYFTSINCLKSILGQMPWGEVVFQVKGVACANTVAYLREVGMFREPRVT